MSLPKILVSPILPILHNCLCVFFCVDVERSESFVILGRFSKMGVFIRPRNEFNSTTCNTSDLF